MKKLSTKELRDELKKGQPKTKAGKKKTKLTQRMIEKLLEWYKGKDQ